MRLTLICTLPEKKDGPKEVRTFFVCFLMVFVCLQLALLILYHLITVYIFLIYASRYELDLRFLLDLFTYGLINNIYCCCCCCVCVCG